VSLELWHKQFQPGEMNVMPCQQVVGMYQEVGVITRRKIPGDQTISRGKHQTEAIPTLLIIHIICF
jgi:hypothetical protein